MRSIVGRLVMAMLAVFLLAAPVEKAMAQTSGLDPENTLLMQLKDGTVTIRLRPDLAPNHVARIKELVRQGFYNGTPFHRVIDGFMAQRRRSNRYGDWRLGEKLNAEFSSAHHVRGTVSMARAASPNSADSQFIRFEPAPFLDGQYTIWGEVVSGMEHVDNIKKGDSSDNGSVSNPDKIVSMTIAADAKQ